MKNEPLKDFASNEAYGNAVYFPHFFCASWELIAITATV